MRSDQRKRLREIRTFPSLVKYLHDELDWPITTGDFEELTFEYTPEEIGIDSKNAAKIQTIRRLRPLSAKPADQPWGIFFVKFEPKRLPVVALRRILSRVAMKKRASANSAERAAWQADDLLFISDYGEGDERRISFAHFSQNEEKGDLPVLKVLGWDNLDTPLHIGDVAVKLAEHLSWPEHEEDADAWREAWSSAFTLKHREVITTSKALAVRLAELARAIRDRINTILAIETEDGPISKLMAAFQQTLVHDLDADGFADMYAQTIAYGLLSARVANPTGSTADDFAAAMPVTNPFLKELMETFLDVGGRKGRASRGVGLDFDELGVSEVVELLDAANMEAVVRDFGDRNPQEDPVIHFYELFLKEYDAKKRMQRGVFYTPRPVVSFIVRSLDELLRTEFDLKDGLADTTTWGEMAERFNDLEIPEGATPDQAFVQILDPATGTGTFLVEVIDLIHKTVIEKWQTDGHGAKKTDKLWNEYVPNHLLPRLHGYELMMAPYAIAHMKIGLKLYETGYRFGSNERARVYLTNSLEPAEDFSGTLEFAIPALAHEAEAVNGIKRDRRFTVVIGNPPYSVSSRNNSTYIKELLEPYKAGVRHERNIQPLSDDYVKFVRLAHALLEVSGVGALGMITNSSFLSGLVHRCMRGELLEFFSIGTIVDLHGSAKIEIGVSRDENVFDIMQGVCISILLRRAGDGANTCELRHRDLRGSRDEKHRVLKAETQDTLARQQLSVIGPRFFFVPKDFSLGNEFMAWPGLREIFPVMATGVGTGKDGAFVSFDRAPLVRLAEDIADEEIGPEELHERYGLKDTGGWNFSRRRSAFELRGALEPRICEYYYRPFDVRYVLYDPIIRRDQRQHMRHMQADNVALLVSAQQSTLAFHHVMCSDRIVDESALSNRTKERCYVVPLYLYSGGGSHAELDLGERELRCNISSSLMQRVSRGLGCEWIGARGGSTSREIGAADVFAYTYALMHSPTYRERYAEFLRIDMPRVPMTRSLDAFRALAEVGSRLVNLHLMRDPRPDVAATSFIGSRGLPVESVSYTEGTVWIDRRRTRGFTGVTEETWGFRVGCYQVCEKWLKDRQARGGKRPRPGRVLTDDEIERYRNLVAVLGETIRAMRSVDDIVEVHGGWPGAFEGIKE